MLGFWVFLSWKENGDSIPLEKEVGSGLIEICEMLICGSQIELRGLMIGLVVSEIRFTVVLLSQIDHLCNKT